MDPFTGTAGAATAKCSAFDDGAATEKALLRLHSPSRDSISVTDDLRPSPALSPYARVDGVFINRMQHLQALVTELNHEIGSTGTWSEGARVVELRARIAELTREEADPVGDYVVREQQARRRGSVATTAVPPPYEARQD